MRPSDDANLAFGQRGVAQPGQSIGLQNRGPRVRILPPLPPPPKYWLLWRRFLMRGSGGRGRRPGLSKQLTTRWYLSAWIVAAIACLALLATTHTHQAGTSPVTPAFYLILAASAIAMLVFWIGALVRLAQLDSWGWFVAVLFLHLIGLGIVGMVAYAIAGPEDSTIVVIRPPMAS